MTGTLIVQVLIGQVIVATVVIVVLKKILDRRLMETAVKQFEFWPEEERDKPITKIVVVTHTPVSSVYKQRIEQAAVKHSRGSVRPEFLVDKSIKGGVVIQTNLRAFEFSLKSRWKQAFP